MAAGSGEKQALIEGYLKTLQELTFCELRHMLRKCGRPEGEAKNMEGCINDLRKSMFEKIDKRIIHITEVIVALATLEHVDTSRLRAMFMESNVPLEKTHHLETKEGVLSCPRHGLQAEFKRVLIDAEQKEFDQLLADLMSKTSSFTPGMSVWYTVDHSHWRRGKVVTTDPMLVADAEVSENIEAAEFCLEETYFAAEIKAAFSAADISGDGCLQTGELTRVMQALGFVQTTSEMDAIFQALDSDGSGEIDYKEFVDWVMGGGEAKLAVVGCDDWTSGIDAPGAERPGDSVDMALHGSFEMNGPGVTVICKADETKDPNASKEAEGASPCEWQLLGTSRECIEAFTDAGVSPVCGFEFSVQGSNFELGLTTAKHRHCGSTGMDIGVWMERVVTPYDTTFEIRITELGVTSPAKCGKYKEGGRSHIKVEINEKGKVEFRHDGVKFFTSKKPLGYPLFVKAFTGNTGPLIQDLKWAGRSAPDKPQPKGKAKK